MFNLRRLGDIISISLAAADISLCIIAHYYDYYNLEIYEKKYLTNRAK